MSIVGYFTAQNFVTPLCPVGGSITNALVLVAGPCVPKDFISYGNFFPTASLPYGFVKVLSVVSTGGSAFSISARSYPLNTVVTIPFQTSCITINEFDDDYLSPSIPTSVYQGLSFGVSAPTFASTSFVTA